LDLKFWGGFRLGYRLTLKQLALIIDLFYAGVCMRKISRIFRAHYGIPTSPATILRRILYWVEEVDGALIHLLERGGLGEFLFGDVWEIDEMYLKLRSGELALIIVRDLKTGFDLGWNLTYPVTTESVKITLEKAKATAKKCPLELRCDGLPVYDAAARGVFGNQTTLSIHKRIGKMGQNQAQEGHNGTFRARFNAMKSLHSREKSPIIVNGLIIDYNFVNPSPALSDMTPAEVAQNRKPVDERRSWLMLLEHAVSYKKSVHDPQKTDRRVKNGNSTLDRFLT
jgi:hypothetical protein